MNLSGSSSSLASNTSTKGGTANQRSYGIGGAILHKKILLMTRQPSPEREEERESRQHSREESRKEERAEERETEVEMEVEQIETPTGIQRERPATPPLDPGEGRRRPLESPLRKRLRSPFKLLRERSQSRERLMVSRPPGAPAQKGALPSLPRPGSSGLGQLMARRSASPGPFTWFCRSIYEDRPHS